MIGTDTDEEFLSNGRTYNSRATNIPRHSNMIHFISFLHNIQDPGVIMIHPFFHKQLTPFGVDPLVQRHADGIHLRYGRVEMRFEVAVCSERFTDMARSAVFGIQLDGFIVHHVFYMWMPVDGLSAVG